MVSKIEIFTAGCALCSEAISTVREATKYCGCEVIEHRIGRMLSEQAEKYKIQSVPSVVIDGQLVYSGKVSSEELKKYLGGKR